MATDPTVRKLLLDKLGITRQALSQRAQRLKKKYGPMTTEEAVYVIAHTEGIDLSKYLSSEILDKVRSLVPLDSQQDLRVQNQVSRTKKSTKPPPTYPLISQSRASSSKSWRGRLPNIVHPREFNSVINSE
jgi:hypothetical protein